MKNIFKKKLSLDSHIVILLSSLYMVIFDNNAFWFSLFDVIDMSSWWMYLFLFACFSVILSVLVIFLSVFGIGFLLKPLISLLFIIASITAYYMDGYGTVFDDVMVLNIVETTVQESMDLVEPSIFFHVLLTGVLPVLLLSRIQIRKQVLKKSILLRTVSAIVVFAIASLTVYVTYKDFTFIFRENREISFFINPVYPLRAVYRYTAEEIRKSNARFEHVFKDAHTTKSYDKKNIFILVVGETARTQSFHINGYHRQTTPEIEKRDVISFKDVSSCGTATAISLPCMFSDLVKDDFEHNKAKSRENLLDALHIAGINVLWRENNPDCKGVCNRIEVHNPSVLRMKKLCNGHLCFDEVLFKGLDKYIKKLDGDAVIVLHTQGSHGPAYYRRYPEAFKKFVPECRTSDVQNCTDTEVVNAYDNTILYTDFILGKTIDYLKQLPDSYNTAMLYVSDHGESLGEKGVYLHGLPYFMAPEYQTKVPMILWLSEGMQSDKSLDRACLLEKSREPLTHDHFLHSVMGFMDVSAQRYEKDLDLFASCRKN